jgi:hypothetical protein
MGTIAAGVFKKLTLKKQTGLGVKAPAGAGGSSQYQRRVTSTINLKKPQYQSAEINPTQQVDDSRHGVKQVEGSWNCELSVGGYQKPFESLLRQAAQVMGATAAATTISATAAVAPATGGTVTRSAGSFITDGWKVGDLFRMTGWTAPATANNALNCVIASIAANGLSMVVFCPNGKLLTAKAAGDNVALAAVGRKTWVPLTGHTRDYYTIEHFQADILDSEQFVDCVFTTGGIKLPATGMATVDFGLMGLNMETGTAEYFTTPANAPSGPLVAAVNGALVFDGGLVGTVTAAEVNVTGNYTAIGGVVGSNVDPDIIPGKVTAAGNLTALLSAEGVVLRDKFVNETKMVVILVFTSGTEDNADAFVIVMSNVKLGGADKDDGEKAISMSVPFVASRRIDGSTVHLPTTISIQDTLFA